MSVFDEGSPKESHRTTVWVAVLGCVVLLAASLGAGALYRADDDVDRIVAGNVWATTAAVLVIPLLLAWHRGRLDGMWPVWVSMLLSASAIVMTVGDLWRAHGADEVVAISSLSYVTAVAAGIVLIACVVTLVRPVVERSESRSNWIPRSRR